MLSAKENDDQNQPNIETLGLNETIGNIYYFFFYYYLVCFKAMIFFSANITRRPPSQL